MTAKRFDKTTQEIIATEYQTGVSLRNLAKKYDCDRDAITTALRYQNAAIRRVANNNRYTFDIHAFDDLDEPACYWLGFLYADGTIANDRSVTINLQRRDRDHLGKFLTFMRSDARIRDTINKIGQKEYLRSSITITHKYFGQRFAELGLNPKNPENAFHVVSLQRHWIRGLFDGDGAAYSSSLGGISFMGERILMQLIHQHFLSAGVDNNPTRSIQRHTISDIYHLQYSGRNVAIRILDYLYQDATVWLERKRQTVASWPKRQVLARNEKGRYYNPARIRD